MGAVFDLLLNLVLTWTLSIFIDAVSDMQTPFGGEKLDMPGLSYVCAAAELSLRMVHRGAEGNQKHQILSVLNDPLDTAALLRTVSAEAEAIAMDQKGKKEEDEEEEDEDGD